MDVKRPGILMVIPAMGMGGAQRSFVKLANWLSERYDVTVVVFDRTFENVYSGSINVQYLGEVSPANPVGKLINFRKRAKKLKQLKKTLGPVVSISFLEGADYLNILTIGIGKTVISIRGSKKMDPHIRGLQGFIRRTILIPFFYRAADKIVAASVGLGKEMNEVYPGLKNKVCVIPNGYDLSCQPKGTIRSSANFILGWSGRFGDEKGLIELIEVFKRCHATDSALRLLLIGKGPLQKHIETLLAESGKRVACCTEIHTETFQDFDVAICNPGNRYEETLGLSDLFVLSSPSEGFPNVLVEAMQLNVPVVSTDCQWGPREILEPSMDYSKPLQYPYYGKYGVLLPVLNLERNDILQMWCNTILELRNNSALLNQYRARIVKGILPYDQESVKKQWFDLLTELT